MNDKKFWKIVYLYVTKYNYEVIQYRPEKQDIWLINNHNELLRFVYSDEAKATDVDASVYNIIKNEKTLKTLFKLSSLKVKVIYISPEIDSNIPEYKKYKISEELLIERVIFSEKNRDKFIKREDDKFIDLSIDNDRYKQRVIESYKNKYKTNYLVNFYFNFVGIAFIILFSINFLILYYTNSEKSLYSYLEYNYQEIISGNFYRLFSSLFVFNSISQLLLVIFFVFLCSILLGEDIKLLSSILILLSVTFITNLFLVFGYIESLSSSNIAFFGLLGSVFVLEFNRRTNNLKFMYAIALPILYLLISTLITEINLAVYIFAFVLGIFIQIAMLRKINIFISYGIVLIIILVGGVINVFDLGFKESINNYNLKFVESRLTEVTSSSSTEKLERELTTNNKSILTYYELGNMRIITSSLADAKKIFLEGIAFDNTFAPIYYKLALIERADGDYNKSLEYINRAIYLDSNNSQYNDLKEEIEQKG